MESRNNGQQKSINVLLGRRLKILRENAGLSETMMAEAINMPVEAFRQFEAGAASIDTQMIVALARTLDASIASFFDITYDGVDLCEDHKIPSAGEIEELLYYFTGVASPLARRKVIAGARSASSAVPVPASKTA